MAINWTTAQAAKAIKEGNKEAITDIGKRFPLFLAAVASNDIDTILAAIPEHITARKIEAVLKDGVQNSDVEDTDTDTDTEGEKSPKKEENKKTGRGRKPKAKAKESAEDDEEEEEDPVALYKECKKAGLKVKARQSVEYYKTELAKLEEASEDDWDDDEEEEVPKKNNKKSKKAPMPEPEPEDDDDDDDWDI